MGMNETPMTKTDLGTRDEYEAKLAQYFMLDTSNIRMGATQDGHPCPGLVCPLHLEAPRGLKYDVNVSILRGNAPEEFHLLFDVTFEETEFVLKLALAAKPSMLNFLGAATTAGVWALLDKDPTTIDEGDEIQSTYLRTTGEMVMYSDHIANYLLQLAKAGFIDPEQCDCERCVAKREERDVPDPLGAMLNNPQAEA